jgi:TIR domain-containing protein
MVKHIAIRRLQSLIERAPAATITSEHTGWERSAKIALRKIFGENSDHLKEFEKAISVQTQKALLQSMIEEIKEDWDSELPEGQPTRADNDMPVFPDITPSKITESVMYVIEPDDIKSEKDLQSLIHQMFDYPDRDFYLFQEKDGTRNDRIIAADTLGTILMSETEFFYYKHPNFERDYIKIERPDGNYKWDWEREVVEKGPMFMRTKLKLTERTNRQLDAWQRIGFEEEFRRRMVEKNEFDVFLSYGSQDQELANQLFDAIEAAGGKAFLSEKSLRPGEDFAETIRNALRKSHELWLLVSPNSLRSDWVISEWGAAWALGKRIIPILYRCAPDSLPDRIKRLHCIDFHKYHDLVKATFPKSANSK